MLYTFVQINGMYSPVRIENIRAILEYHNLKIFTGTAMYKAMEIDLVGTKLPQVKVTTWRHMKWKEFTEESDEEIRWICKVTQSLWFGVSIPNALYIGNGLFSEFADWERLSDAISIPIPTEFY